MSIEGCIRKDCISRIISDVKEITINPLHKQNIYYQHDEDNILNGYALIIGAKDTPYENGYYFFRFMFPPDYPYKPPTVYYLTNDGITRFHPNLYRNGKCCLSILNTWKGDEWTSCITLSTVLLSLCILFTNNPLIHEPGITEKHSELEYYNEIIKYKNYEVAIYGILKKKGFIYDLFSGFIEKHFIENKNDILNNLEKENKLNKKTKKLSVSVYDMTNIEINYSKLIKNIKKIEIK
tara:strand:+ start:1605 stop:2315 length:711 start_codon:yes stop_codon:yes gene_type:complete